MGSPDADLVRRVYSYMGDLMSLDQMRSSTTVRLPQYLNVINTSLQWTTWVAWRQHHPDRMLANYITQGLREGFRIEFSGSLSSVRRASWNMLSVIQNPEVVQDYVLGLRVYGRQDYRPTGTIRLPQNS